MKRRQRLANPLRHPVGAAILKRQIMLDLRSLLVDAQLHALIGANDPQLIDHGGRLAYITAQAARDCKLPEGPDLRIVTGMAHALADLAGKRGDRDLHRLAIQSGLLAAERVLVQCDAWAIGKAALMVDQRIQSAAGLTLHDIAPPKQETLA